MILWEGRSVSNFRLLRYRELGVFGILFPEVFVETTLYHILDCVFPRVGLWNFQAFLEGMFSAFYLFEEFRIFVGGVLGNKPELPIQVTPYNILTTGKVGMKWLPTKQAPFNDLYE